MKPLIEIYHGQSLAPPDKKGLTAGNGYWLKFNAEWYRIEWVREGERMKSDNMHNIFQGIKKLFGLRKWPEDFT